MTRSRFPSFKKEATKKLRRLRKSISMYDEQINIEETSAEDLGFSDEEDYCKPINLTKHKTPHKKEHLQKDTDFHHSDSSLSIWNYIESGEWTPKIDQTFDLKPINEKENVYKYDGNNTVEHNCKKIKYENKIKNITKYKKLNERVSIWPYIAFTIIFVVFISGCLIFWDQIPHPSRGVTLYFKTR